MVELHVIIKTQGKTLRCPHTEANKTHTSTNFLQLSTRQGQSIASGCLTVSTASQAVLSGSHEVY